MQPYVRAGVLEHFRSTVIALGANPDDVLRKANVSAEALEISGSYIPHENYRYLLYCAAEATNCPHFAMEMIRH